LNTRFIAEHGFCFKACDPAGPNAAHYCEHIYDRIGCAYNAPNNAQDGVFERCEGDNQDFPGVYTVDGEVRTYTQPPESLGAISTMPYEPRVPASSNCVPFQSSALFVGLPTATGASTSPTATGTGTGGAGPSGNGNGAATRTGTSGGAGSTESPNAAVGVRAAVLRQGDAGGFAGAVIALAGVALTAMLVL
jgi:hypothetical protein